MEPPIIVVVEDNEFSASVIRRTVELAGYHCEEARTEHEVLETCRLHGDRVRALIADLVLPGARGTEIALRVNRNFPDVPVLFVSGTPFEAWSEVDCRKAFELPAGTAAFLGKPFLPAAMMGKLAELLERRGRAALNEDMGSVNTGR
jgi:two-component system, cell cycle sensor histidine kinase and response regulator CckA